MFACILLQVIPELYVDASRGEKLRINMEIVFPKMPCACKNSKPCLIS